MSTLLVFIPCYNAARYIKATIQSVLNQTYQEFEVIVLDDCSTDESYSLALECAATDIRIKVYRNEHNLGMLGNWNKGINLCDSRYFVKLDADDIWETSFLEKAMSVMNSIEKVGIVFTRYINIDENSLIINGSDKPLPFFAKNKSFSCIPLVAQGPKKMLSYPILQQGLSIIRKDVFNKVGPYKHLITEETQAATDTEFYFRAGAHFDIFCIDEPLYRYRVHEQSISVTDKGRLIGDQKIYETKRCIIEYYAGVGLLDKNLAKQFLKEIEAIYTFSKIAYFRNTGNTSAFLNLLTTTFLRHPLKTLAFYKGRLEQKRVQDA